MITSTITEMYQEQVGILKKTLSCTEGRISLTTDMWSDTGLDGYMAITVHYIIRSRRGLEYCTDLLAFRYVEGSHIGINLADHFLRVLDEFEIASKVSPEFRGCEIMAHDSA